MASGPSCAYFRIITALLVSLPLAFSQQRTGNPHDDYPVQLTEPLPPDQHGSNGGKPDKEKPLFHTPVKRLAGNVSDPVQQTSAPAPATAQTAGQWEGLGAGYPGFSVTAVPPDPNLAVGPNHIVQWVNNAMVIFDKQGNQLRAPVADSTFWGANSTCNQLGGYSDPIVKYDRIADRWIVGEVALPLFPGLFGQYATCFAVSKTGDPTYTSNANGTNTAYYIWTYGFSTNIPDYDKIAVWPDGYYVTWNIFQNANTFTGPEVCSWNRNDMLTGVAAPRFKCFTLTNHHASLLAADADGGTAPPAGSPNFVMEIDQVTGGLNLWKFHVDYVTPANSTLTGPIAVAGVAAYTQPCPTTQNCIPQPGTTQALDALGDRLMYRLAYRNFGDHESIAANHTVLTTGGNTAVRWYEVRNPAGSPTVYQQGTFTPDTENRWMASLAMDKSGNIGVGYSVSSAVTNPSIRYAGWETGNPLGTLQAETHFVDGGGSQTGYDRWGDYSAMQIDPADDCTFWYTQEYQATTQSANWNTRIGSFKFPSCGQALAATTTTVGSSANPSTFGQSVTLTATVTSGTGTPAGTVTFKDGGTVLGSSALSSGQATLSTSTLATGGHSITATYNGDSTHASSTSAALSQTVNPAGTSTALGSSANPSIWGQNVTFTATVTSGTGTPTGTVTFKDGATVLGSSALSSGQASLSTSTLATGGHSITATYNGDSTHASSTSAALSQTVTQAGTTTTLTSSPNPSNVGQTVTFTATISPSAGTGTVVFTIDSTKGSPVAVSAGKAMFATSALAAGGHQVTAAYSGDGNYTGSTSSTLSQTVNAGVPTFSISASPGSRTVTHGSATTYTVTATPSNGFSGTVSLSVSGLPSRANGSFNPSSIAGSGTSTLTVSTNRRTSTGTYTLTIRGTSGSIIQTAQVTLIVN